MNALPAAADPFVPARTPEEFEVLFSGSSLGTRAAEQLRNLASNHLDAAAADIARKAREQLGVPESTAAEHSTSDRDFGVVIDGADVESDRERIVRAACDLFSRYGTRAVGVDAVIGEAGVAKMALYRNFASKDDLILAFLQRREELWTYDWLWAESQRRGESPAQRLLAIFELFGEWFARPDFEGCSFVTTLLEVTNRDSAVRQATVQHLANIRSYLCELASQAGVQDPDSFTRQWHILMKGSIIAAAEGDTYAAARARELGILLLTQHGIAIS